MKKVLVILTGGTFAMVAKDEHKALSPSVMDGEWILKFVPELKLIADVDWVSLFNIDSSNMSPQHWDKIAKVIQELYDSYDGFVVVHGTDTMVYSATALSFIMSGTEKPIIFTGSQKPLKAIRTDARNNLIGAVELASFNIPEVAIFFNNTLLRANRTTKISTEDYAAFYSYNYPPLAKIGVKVDIKDSRFMRAKKPVWRFGFDTDIAVFKMFPGFKSAVIDKSFMDTNIKGVIIEGFGAGNIPELDSDWLDLIERLTKQNKVVIITSQCTHGTVDLSLYQNGKKALLRGAIDSHDMTTEASIVKLMFALKHFKAYDKVINFMKNTFAGEMSA